MTSQSRPCRSSGPLRPTRKLATHGVSTPDDRSRGLGVDRDTFMLRLHEMGIEIGVPCVGVHLQPFYQDHLGLHPEPFPNANWIRERTVSLSFSPAVDEEAVEDVIGAVHGALDRGGR